MQLSNMYIIFTWAEGIVLSTYDISLVGVDMDCLMIMTLSRLYQYLDHLPGDFIAHHITILTILTIFIIALLVNTISENSSLQLSEDLKDFLIHFMIVNPGNHSHRATPHHTKQRKRTIRTMWFWLRWSGAWWV